VGSGRVSGSRSFHLCVMESSTVFFLVDCWQCLLNFWFILSFCSDCEIFSKCGRILSNCLDDGALLCFSKEGLSLSTLHCRLDRRGRETRKKGQLQSGEWDPHWTLLQRVRNVPYELLNSSPLWASPLHVNGIHWYLCDTKGSELSFLISRTSVMEQGFCENVVPTVLEMCQRKCWLCGLVGSWDFWSLLCACRVQTTQRWMRQHCIACILCQSEISPCFFLLF